MQRVLDTPGARDGRELHVSMSAIDDSQSAPSSQGSESDTELVPAKKATARSWSGLRRRVRLAVLVGGTLFVGMFAHHWLAKKHAPEHGLLESLYFLVQVTTTVGYGDIVPLCRETRMFMTVYILVVVVEIAYAANLAANWVINSSAEHLRANLLASDGNPSGVVSQGHKKLVDLGFALCFFSVCVVGGAVFFRITEDCSCSYGLTWVGNESCPQEVFDISRDDCQMAGGQVKTWVDAFYMSVVTVTTVGFGDFTPMTRAGRTFAIFWMLIGVAATGAFVSACSEFLFSEGEDLQPEEALHIDRPLFEKIDVSGDGRISRAEYYEHVLVKNGIATQDVMDLLRSKFDSFNSKDGENVTWEEMSIARRVQRDLTRGSSGGEQTEEE